MSVDNRVAGFGVRGAEEQGRGAGGGARAAEEGSFAAPRSPQPAPRFSLARHHADWLSLIEISGPFVSLPVLQRVFPQGLDARDPGQAKALRAAYETWQDNPQAPGQHRAWLSHVLTQLLGYPEQRISEGQSLPAGLEAQMPEMGETLRPDFALLDEDSKAHLLISHYPAGQSLNKAIPGKHWKAHPATRMMELLHGANIALGLVTNGEHWLLVYAPRGEATGYASWYAALWLDEPVSLRAFHSLLGVRRFFGVAEGETLRGMLKESAQDQQEVTDQLGDQVREAVEVLVQSFDALDQDSQRSLLQGVGATALYEAALTVMMRLVFLFSAEERGLLHLGKPLYDENYAVSTLQEQLQETADQYGEEVLERRSDAWARLLATFRAVHGGIAHQDLLMPAYGGSLFDSDRYPFLEGRGTGGGEWEAGKDGTRAAGRGEREQQTFAISRTTGGKTHDNSKLSGVGSLEAFDGFGGTVLSGDEEFSQRGIVRDGQSDSSGGGIGSSKHRGGSRTSIDERVSPLSQHCEGVFTRTGDSPHAKPARRVDNIGVDPTSVANVRAHQSDAGETAAVFGEKAVNCGEREAGGGERGMGSGERERQDLTPPGVSAPPASRSPLSVYPNNRVTLHLLNALQRLRVKAGGTTETRRVSFRALGVEQIGHVYEGLLDHTARRADEPVLGLKGTRHKDAEIPLATLEGLLAQGQDKLLEFLKDETGRSVPALKKALECKIDLASPVDEHALLKACHHNETLLARVRPFAGLIREDSFERPLIVLPGSVYVTSGTTRRSTGTHYTPPTLTEPVVQHTLEPLVYQGPAQGWAKEHWALKSPKEILELKVCDMAMGSGAFLVQACRYLAERLVEAWENAEQQQPGEILITPEGGFSQGIPSERLVPADADERLAIARRVVADRCLYGVDINPMAVEMAKLSLWLITMDANRPFTFLDHAFKCGDSLLGITALKQLENFSLREGGGKQLAFATMNLFRHIDEAKKKRETLEALPSDTPAQIAAKAALYAEAEDAVAKLNAAADVLVAVELQGLRGRAYEQEREKAADHMLVYWAEGLDELRSFARRQLQGRRCLHWDLAFPEIIEAGGFHAFIGNPPFMGGLKLETAYGSNWRDHIVENIANGVRGLRGTADLCAYFLLRAILCLKDNSIVGAITTNSISDGDTREIGLQQLVKNGITIIRANPSNKWPGEANLEVALIWLRKGQWCGAKVLDDKLVEYISPRLANNLEKTSGAYRLLECSDKAFMGATVLGVGFTMSPEEAAQIISQNASNRSVLFPHVNGDDINSRPDCSPSRWIINFFNWSLEQAERFPLCIEWLRNRVKPERDALMGRNVVGTRRATYWWRYAQDANTLFRTIEGMARVLVKSGVSKYHAFAFLPTGFIPSHAVFVFAFEDYGSFGVLQSSFHETWTIENASSLETRLRYTPMSCFETFVFPKVVSKIEDAGRSFYELRAEVMLAHYEGLTKTYNRFHNPAETSPDIAELRRLHVAMDEAVAAAYGWQDMIGGAGSANRGEESRGAGSENRGEESRGAGSENRGAEEQAFPASRAPYPESRQFPAPRSPNPAPRLNHGFHETKQGIRYTISEEARREILDRLLELNHQRHAEEVAAGLHDKKTGKPAASRQPQPPPTGSLPQVDMFGHAQADVFDTSDAGREAGSEGREKLALPHPAPRISPPGSSLLDYFQAHPGWHSKDTLLTSTGFPANRWNAEIKRLQDSGQVEREGDKRGAKYRFRGA